MKGWHFSRSIKDLLEWFAIPALSAVLPWRTCFSLYRRFAANDQLVENTATSFAAAQYHNKASNSASWASEFRLTHIVDRADAILSRFRSNRWLDKHLVVSGDSWPEGAFVGITYHFGAGLWAIRHLCRHERTASFLSARFDGNFFGDAKLRYAYARFRMREVSRAGHADVIYTGGSVERIRTSLAEGTAVLGLIDVPPSQASGDFGEVEFLGRAARFPLGLLLLARDACVPVALFTASISADGTRRLHIRKIEGEILAQLRQITNELDRLLDEQPAAWHRWADVSAFFNVPD